MLNFFDSVSCETIIAENEAYEQVLAMVRLQFSKECQSSPEAKEDYDNMKEMLRLKRENEELRKENLFLKKAAAFFAKEID